MKIKRMAPQNESGVRTSKGIIASDRAPGESIWQEDGDKIYVTCRGCSAINDISEFFISPDGVVNPCVTCVNCGTHYWTVLGDWDGRTSFHCQYRWHMGRTKEQVPKDLDKKWVNGCFRYACPECARRHHEQA